jgi:hypothetical protein
MLVECESEQADGRIASVRLERSESGRREQGRRWRRRSGCTRRRAPVDVGGRRPGPLGALPSRLVLRHSAVSRRRSFAAATRTPEVSLPWSLRPSARRSRRRPRRVASVSETESGAAVATSRSMVQSTQQRAANGADDTADEVDSLEQLVQKVSLARVHTLALCVAVYPHSRLAKQNKNTNSGN